jgi:hypothetical protein
VHQAETRPIIQLPARGPGHSLNFAASEALVQVAVSFGRVWFAQGYAPWR